MVQENDTLYLHHAQTALFAEHKPAIADNHIHITVHTMHLYSAQSTIPHKLHLFSYWHGSHCPLLHISACNMLYTDPESCHISLSTQQNKEEFPVRNSFPYSILHSVLQNKPSSLQPSCLSVNDWKHASFHEDLR